MTNIARRVEEIKASLRRRQDPLHAAAVRIATLERDVTAARKEILIATDLLVDAADILADPNTPLAVYEQAQLNKADALVALLRAVKGVRG